MHGDDVFLDGSLFTVQNRTFDYDNHICTVTIVRDGRITETFADNRTKPHQRGEALPVSQTDSCGPLLPQVRQAEDRRSLSR
jgi:hypothetical protein